MNYIYTDIYAKPTPPQTHTHTKLNPFSPYLRPLPCHACIHVWAYFFFIFLFIYPRPLPCHACTHVWVPIYIGSREHLFAVPTPPDTCPIYGYLSI